MSWNIKTPGDYINGPLTVAGVAQFNSNVGIGITPIYRLDVQQAGGITATSSFAVARFTGANAVANDITLIGPNTSQTRLNFGDQDASNSGEVGYDHSTNRLRFVVNGSVAATLNSNAAFVLAGGSVSANGVGVAFPAAQSASTDANTLDDYEEGSFTPVIQGSTTAGTATYVTRYGYYTKVGRLVTVNIFIDWNSHTGTGDTRIAGLPFTNSSTFSAATIGYANSIAVTANYMIAAYVDASNSWILLNQIPTGGGGNTTVPIDAAGALVISASYII